MTPVTINGKKYRLPGGLNDFQLALYMHLIDWKWRYVTTQPGTYRGIDYDAILPAQLTGQYPTVYPAIVQALKGHQRRFPFRAHTHFHHMASSQAANINLFLPVLRHPRADDVLRQLRPDFDLLATNQLDHGYRIEYWDEPYGCLNDKTRTTGTDADIGIAYYNRNGELCLWLIEHKLTESEFTTCGGYRSKGRTTRHDCGQGVSAILQDKGLCYYHEHCHYRYWDITAANLGMFPNHARYTECPFRGGMNQLWRNQLLALAVEQGARQPYKHASFSVVRHPRNTSLDATLNEYRTLTGHDQRFTTFTSADVLNAASAVGDVALDAWVAWYRGLYDVP